MNEFIKGKMEEFRKSDFTCGVPMDKCFEMETFIGKALSQYKSKVIEVIEDHYFDSLEKDREIIIKHIKQALNNIRLYKSSSP